MKNLFGGRSEKANISPIQQGRSFIVDEKKPSPIAIIYRSEYDYISRCVLDYPSIETGGDLFGFWTNDGIPVVLYAIGPGHSANHQDAFFVQDIGYFEKIASTLNNRYQLSHMGEWHSHHQMGLTRPSGHDANTIFGGLRNVPLRHMLLCIANYRNGKTTINPYTFHENDLSHFRDAYWHVVPMKSPFRQIIDEELKRTLIHPHTLEPCHGDSRVIGSSPSKQNIYEDSPLKANHWLRQPGKVDLLRKMIAFVQSQWLDNQVNPQWDEKGNVQLTVGDGLFAIGLPMGFPGHPPRLIVSEMKQKDFANWTYNPEFGGDDENDQILSAFITWVTEEKQIIESITDKRLSYDDTKKIWR